MVARTDHRPEKGEYGIWMARIQNEAFWTIVNLSTHRSITCHSCWEWIQLLDQDMDLHQSPPKSFNLRSWESNPDAMDHDPLPCDPSPEIMEIPPTFILKVQYRQNANWQGRIQWTKGNQIKTFRSVMELLKLVDDAVLRMQDKPSEPMESWD